MSGVSLAMAPRSEPDQAISGKPQQKPSPAQPSPAQQQRQPLPMVGGVMGSIRVIELQLVAFILVFSASGLVPLLDLIFPAFTSAYLIALSQPGRRRHQRSSREGGSSGFM